MVHLLYIYIMLEAICNVFANRQEISGWESRGKESNLREMWHWNGERKGFDDDDDYYYYIGLS